MTVSVLRRGSSEANWNPHVAIWHFLGAEACKPLSPYCITGLCLHSRRIPASTSCPVPPGQYSARAKATPSELRMLVSTLFCCSVARRPTKRPHQTRRLQGGSLTHLAGPNSISNRTLSVSLNPTTMTYLLGAYFLILNCSFDTDDSPFPTSQNSHSLPS